LGLPQYTTGPPPAPLLLLLLELPPPAPLLLLLLDPLGWQLAVCEFGSTTQVNPLLQPQIVQSPGWHWPSCPQVSFVTQSPGPLQPGVVLPVDEQSPGLQQSPGPQDPPPLLGKMGQPARIADSKPTKPSR
jgi:hypothetical protein